MDVFAHRGASGICPENTMAAFEEAVRQEAAGIETDVQMTRDGVLVLCHDERLERTTNGKGLVAEMDSRELLALDAGGWFAPAFAGERVPLLSDLLALAVRHGLTINLELKNYIVRYPGMEEKVLAEVQRHNAMDQVILSSFSHPSMYRVKKLEPGIRTGLLVCCELQFPVEYAGRCLADAIHPDHETVTEAFVGEVHGGGLQVNVYTADRPGDILRMRRCGADVLMTNYPQEALLLLSQSGEG